jgi:protein-S-isoprenylcysteine O-methyltransferase Ste14
MYGSRAVLNKLNPSVVQSRQESIRKDTKAFDRFFLRSFLLLIIIFPIVAGFDAVRFHWSGFPYWTVYLGIALFAPSAVLITWTLAMNPHAETSVRIQSDRGHSVIHSGPYRFVRHPMYVGLILLYMSMSFILGSVATFWVATAITILVLWRTALEDRTLRRELPGYENYTSMTRYRLMPGIW